MPNIAQQDYIIIDWEGKDSSDATKKAAVDAKLKNIYLANPLTVLSVLFKHYGENVTEKTYYPILGIGEDALDNSISVVFHDVYNGEMVYYAFSIA